VETRKLLEKLESAKDKMLSAGFPISKFGIFGSCIHNPMTQDIDILLTLLNKNNVDLHINEILSIVSERMLGNYTTPAPIDKYSQNYLLMCIKILNEEIGLPIVYGLGPANQNDFTGQFVHLNGPICDELWTMWVKQYPFHGITIRNNYLPIVGDLPYASNINGDALLDYSKTMRNRNKVMPSIKYADKVIKVLALFSDEKRAIRHEAIKKVFQCNIPIMKSIDCFFEKAAEIEAQELTEYLLDLIDVNAHLMKYFNLSYPDDWEVS
jgi:predicted nucleotidyltransferase